MLYFVPVYGAVFWYVISGRVSWTWNNNDLAVPAHSSPVVSTSWIAHVVRLAVGALLFVGERRVRGILPASWNEQQSRADASGRRADHPGSPRPIFSHLTDRINT